MAEFADRGDPTQLYTAIEKAYCEDRWPDVLEQGEKLLSELPADDLGLRQRLQLLMAHTFLYGYGDRDSAEDLYRAVHDSKAESALRQIASQGLQQCDLPPERLPASTATPLAATPQVQVEVPQSRPALDPADLPRPVSGPALEEEDVASLHDSVQQALSPETAPAWSEPPAAAPALEESRAAVVDPFAAPPSAAGSAPVMPWLEEPAAAAGQPWSGTAAPEAMVDATAEDPAGIGAESPGTDDAGAGMPPLLTVDVTEPHGAPSLDSLIPDVIDEPEMVEVHQADPSLAEEFELQETAAAAVGPTTTAEVPWEREQALPALARTDPAIEPAVETAPAEAPPEEDPELLGGLLRVEII